LVTRVLKCKKKEKSTAAHGKVGVKQGRVRVIQSKKHTTKYILGNPTG